MKPPGHIRTSRIPRAILLVVGCVLLVSLQAIINIGGVTAGFPTKDETSVIEPSKVVWKK